MAKEPVDRRLPPLSLRLTFGERALLEKKAAGQSLSSYIKTELFAGDGPGFAPGLRMGGSSPRRVETDTRLLAQILAKLGETRLGPSMSDLAQAASTGSLFVSEQVEAQLAQACVDVAEIRLLLLEALGKRRKAAPPKPKTLTEAFNLSASGFIRPRVRELTQ
jgi:hypothetical protein